MNALFICGNVTAGQSLSILRMLPRKGDAMVSLGQVGVMEGHVCVTNCLNVCCLR